MDITFIPTINSRSLQICCQNVVKVSCTITLFIFFQKEINYSFIYIYISLYYYLRDFPCLDSSFFSSKIPLHPYV